MRENSALPDDPNFLGDPKINVSCQASACKARLSADLAQSIPLAVDHWNAARGRVRLVGGSAIVGFMAADAHLDCMNQFADSGSLGALEPCAQVIAHKQLP